MPYLETLAWLDFPKTIVTSFSLMFSQFPLVLTFSAHSSRLTVTESGESKAKAEKYVKNKKIYTTRC